MTEPVSEDPRKLPKSDSAIEDVDITTRGGVTRAHPDLPASGRKSAGLLKNLLGGRKQEKPSQEPSSN